MSNGTPGGGLPGGNQLDGKMLAGGVGGKGGGHLGQGIQPLSPEAAAMIFPQWSVNNCVSENNSSLLFIEKNPSIILTTLLTKTGFFLPKLKKLKEEKTPRIQ